MELTNADQLRDRGWTSPWHLSANGEHQIVTQSNVVGAGDLALEMGSAAALERSFPPVSCGILKIEMSVRLQKATIDIEDSNASVLKVYAGDREDNWACRWHYPFAWPEVGGNIYPRFYVIDGLGKKRKGIEYTEVRAQPERWYRTAAILNFASRTWEYWVDGVRVDPAQHAGRAMAWWQSGAESAYLSKVRIASTAQGKNWIDAISIWHDGALLAHTAFNCAEGYAEGKSPLGERH